MDAPATWPALIGTLVRGEALTADETAWAMGEIMEGAATPAQIAGFGVALRMKGETVAEVSGLAQTMLDARHPDQRAGPAGRPGRHRRRRGPHGQHLHHGRDRRRRGGRAGGQARQPRRLLRLRGR